MYIIKKDNLKNQSSFSWKPNRKCSAITQKFLMDTWFSGWFIYQPLGFPRLKSEEIRFDDLIKKQNKTKQNKKQKRQKQKKQVAEY